MAPSLELVAAALTLAAILLTYRQQRYWQRRAQEWQERLKARFDVLRSLVRDARDTQRAYRDVTAPSQRHAGFVLRCETALRDHFGAGYVARVDKRMAEDWLQPPGLASEEQIFAWYDTERRIAALQELISETTDDFMTISTP